MVLLNRSYRYVSSTLVLVLLGCPSASLEQVGGGDGGVTQDGSALDGNTIDGSTNDAAASDGGREDAASAVCGNSAVESPETCDDGNVTPGDGCSAACQTEAGFNCPVVGEPCEECGNGVIDRNEGCDDGNANPGDGCSAACQTEANYQCPVPGAACLECGDGTVDVTEGCDDGNTSAGDGCNAVCAVEGGWDCSLGVCVAAECGDGQQAGIEGCDDGNKLSGDGCSFRCEVEPGFICITPGIPCRGTVCGDSAVEGIETCDDGNASASDGCSATCTIEDGFDCPTPGSACVATTCGDGTREGTEDCDDGNTNNADGCSSTCTLESGYSCPTPGSACVTTTCGDGNQEGTEECDDGDTDNGDGCSSTCDVEPFFECDPTESSCSKVAEYVAIAEFPAPLAQPQAVHYDPGTRSFIAYGFNAAQGNVEFCLDGTVAGTNTRPRYDVGNGLDGATYDPFNDRFLFVQQSGRLTEVDRETDLVVRTANLAGVGTAGGIVIGEDGRLYVSNHFEESIKVFERFGTTAVDTIPAPTNGPYLDNLFAIPGERLIGYYNLPPGVSSPRQFAFHKLDGSLEGRSTIPGVLFANGRTFPVRSDGGEAAQDGGAFLVCSEYLTNGGSDNGICQLFARRCVTDLECANRISGTACKLDEPIPYCYAVAQARDDFYRVAVNSSGNTLTVSENDSVAEAVCLGAVRRITAVEPGDQGGTISIASDELGVNYSPATGFCGQVESFEYTTDLGGIVDQATVRVLVECVCGDGTQQANEECDDGNTTPGDGCDDRCRREPSCGDGEVGAGEQCDDGNTVAGDGCSPNCTSELI